MPILFSQYLFHYTNRYNSSNLGIQISPHIISVFLYIPKASF